MHYKKAAQSFGSVGKFIIKTPVYKPKQLKEVASSYLSKNTEDYCNLKKLYLQHWALQDMEMEFVIASRNSWDIHKFNFVNVNKSFTVVAESKTCPQIICFEPYCVATLFNITKKFPQTVCCLKNFTIAKLKQLKSQTKTSQLSIEKVSQFIHNSSDFFNFQNNENSNSFQNSRRIQILKKLPESLQDSFMSTTNIPKTARDVAHSGMAYKRHDAANLIVDNNSVGNSVNLQHLEPKKLNTTRTKKSMFRMTGLHLDDGSSVGDDSINQQSIIPTTFRIESASDSKKGFLNSRIMQNGVVGDDDYINQKNSFIRLSHDFKGFSTDRQAVATHDLSQINKPESSFSKSRGEIRQMLYPELPIDCLNNDELWV